MILPILFLILSKITWNRFLAGIDLSARSKRFQLYFWRWLQKQNTIIAFFTFRHDLELSYYIYDPLMSWICNIIIWIFCINWWWRYDRYKIKLTLYKNIPKIFSSSSSVNLFKNDWWSPIQCSVIKSWILFELLSL